MNFLGIKKNTSWLIASAVILQISFFGFLANAETPQAIEEGTVQEAQQRVQETSAGTAAITDQNQEAATAPAGYGIQSVGCEETGDCTIEQIIQKAVYFAQFIMGLSGALFLIVFIYGGALYILSFGRSEWVNKGQKAMVQAAIGIVFVMGAWTIVWYVAQSLGYTG